MEANNMKAMREALENVVNVGYPHNFQHEAPHIRGYCYDITKAITKCFTALSAPPRNCDRFGGDFKMLHTAWFDWTGSPSGQNPDGTVKLTFAEWLLAPVLTKGGAK